MIIAGVQDDEINDVTEANAIREIAGDTGKQQRASSKHAIVVSGSTKEIVKDGDGGSNREYDEKPAAKRAAFLKLAEGDAGVFRVVKLHEAGDHHALVGVAQRSRGPRFRPLIGEINTERGQQVAGAPGEARAHRVGFVGVT